MKKFFITLIILIIIAGTAFMFGWAQFSVPPGKYGVIYSKTHGIDQKTVQSGEFRWIWYKLIPTNVKISIFNLDHNRYPVNFNSSLPSGDTYAAFIGLANTDFSWNLTGELSFKLDPQMLIPVVSKNNIIDQNDLDAYLQSVAQNIEVLLLRLLSSQGTDSVRLEQLMSGISDAELEREIKGNFPEICDFSFEIKSAKYPDFVLYRQLRLIYEGYLSSQREYAISSFGKRAESHMETQLRFEELEHYGELLTKYPILLEYLAMEKGEYKKQ
ncbi:hypothetical protein R84B8_02000 [Treponema sp. R8-4-B8]